MTRRLVGERGSSLLEVVVVVGLLSVVLSATFVSLASFQNTSAGVDERLENLDETRFIMDTLTQDIRTATRPADAPETGTPFLSAGPMGLQFYANLRTDDDKPRLVSVEVADGILTEQVVEPAGTPPALTYPGPPSNRLVGGWVDNTAADPLFTYLDDAGPMVGAGPGGTLTAVQRAAVRSVQISLKVRKDPNPRAPATTVQTSVRLPNLSVTLP